MLELQQVSLQKDGEQFIDEVSLKLERGQLNLLLGPTLSGKTSLLRLMAGLELPSSGEILFDGESVVGKPVQQRNVAMVYQQFINYPTLTVFENIASPLRVAKTARAEIDARVHAAADVLQITALLKRYPNELSGGQQQRVAIARALVKRADLVLLDEPLANLDYKLREDLRSQLPELFAELGVVLVYATTEPLEALALGGNTACLHEGRLVQYGPTLELYHQPACLQAARTFSDPPLNLADLQLQAGQLLIDGHGGPDRALKLPCAGLPDAHYTLGIRPHHLSPTPGSDADLKFSGRVSVTELTGSESFIHFDCNGAPWVALQHGISELNPGQEISCYVAPENVLLFDAQRRLVNNSVARLGS